MVVLKKYIIITARWPPAFRDSMSGAGGPSDSDSAAEPSKDCRLSSMFDCELSPAPGDTGARVATGGGFFRPARRGSADAGGSSVDSSASNSSE
jgi:hypothetical protein